MLATFRKSVLKQCAIMFTACLIQKIRPSGLIVDATVVITSSTNEPVIILLMIDEWI